MKIIFGFGHTFTTLGSKDTKRLKNNYSLWFRIKTMNMIKIQY